MHNFLNPILYLPKSTPPRALPLCHPHERDEGVRRADSPRDRRAECRCARSRVRACDRGSRDNRSST